MYCTHRNKLMRRTNSQPTGAIQNIWFHSKEEVQFSDYKRNTDGTTERKQGLSAIIEISSDSVIDLAKTFDSQETFSEEKGDTDFLENMGGVNTL